MYTLKHTHVPIYIVHDSSRSAPQALTFDLKCLLLHPFQNVGCFDFSRFIYFAMDLDICYIYMHSKHYKSKKAKTTYILERSE